MLYQRHEREHLFSEILETSMLWENSNIALMGFGILNTGNDILAIWKKGASSQVFLWLNSLGKEEHEPERRLSTHLNPTCDSPAQVSYSGGSKMSVRGVFTDLVTLTHRPLGRQIHRYRIAFLIASVAMARVEVTGLHFFLCHTKFMVWWCSQNLAVFAEWEHGLNRWKVEVVIRGYCGGFTNRKQ